MNLMKLRLLSGAGIIFAVFSCTPTGKKLVAYDGFTQGTTFSVKFYASADSTGIKQGIDSILSAINHTASVYDTNSIISKVNANREVGLDPDFIRIFNKSQEISKATGGCFDITVGELVRAWGFGLKNKTELSQSDVDSLLRYTGYRNLSLKDNKLNKKFPQTKLDFNAIAQGYTVDMVADYLLKNTDSGFLVEIGGEVRANGRKRNSDDWVIGIEKPALSETDEQSIQEKITLFNKSVSTSGNYRKFFIKDGIRYSHTIDPQTGYPVHHSLLSVSVIAEDCTTADAYATAFMVMGVEKAKDFLARHPGLQAYFIYSDRAGKNQVFYTGKFFRQGS
jgi:FAD:protein FMN transferase